MWTYDPMGGRLRGGQHAAGARAVAALGLGLLLVTCGGDGGALAPGGTVDVSGFWVFAEGITGRSGGVACQDSGYVEITQSNGAFDGRGQQIGECTVQGSILPFLDSLVLQNGAASQRMVSFSVDGCPYRGTPHGEPVDSVTGSVSCTLGVGGGSKIQLSGSWRLVRSIPAGLSATIDSTTYPVGDTLRISAVASSPFRVQTVRYDLLVNGITFVAESVTIGQPTGSAGFPVEIPPQWIGQLLLTVTMHDAAGFVFSRDLGAISVVYPATQFVASTSASTYLVGDTIRISVQASNPFGMDYLGYRVRDVISPPQTPGVDDSVASTGTTATRSFAIPIGPTLYGTRQVSVFTRTRGVLSETLLPPIGVTDPTTTHSTTELQLSGTAERLVYDAKRNYVYGLRSGTIDVADLTTGTARPSIFFPYPTSGADISPGGDTLLVAVGGRKFAIVNLVTSQVDTVAFAQPGSPGAQGDVAVLANGRAFFAINDFSAAKVVSYDLATGAQATRSDVGPGPALSPSIAFAHSGDGTHLLLLRSTTCCPLPAQLYSTATDQFGTEVGTADHIAVVRASGDQTGGRWLLDDELFDGGLSLVRRLSAAAHILFTTGPTAVAGDGRSVVLGTMDGFLRLDAATGAQLEHVLMTEFPARLLLLPGDTTLVATGGLSSGKLYVVHLLH